MTTDHAHRAYVEYTTNETIAAQFAVYGLLLIAIGLHWGLGGIEPMIQETARGVTIVEGGADRGALLGPPMAGVGFILTSASFDFFRAARVKRDVLGQKTVRVERHDPWEDGLP